MIEVAVGFIAIAVLLGSLCWYDMRGRGDWEALLSPEAREAQEFLRAKFRAEERAVAWSYDRAQAGEPALAAAGARFIAGTVPERLRLLRRMELYWRLVSAIAPPPALRFHALRVGFRALVVHPSDVEQLARAREELPALDTETLEAFRVLVSTLTTIGREKE